MHKTAVGICINCGKSAQWNTPALDDKERLWCDGCADKDRTGILFRSIQQFKKDDQCELTGGVVFNGVVVWHDLSTWIEGGSRSVTLTDEEKNLSPEAIARLLNEEHNVNGLWRCTGSGCGHKMKKEEVAGWPLFAGCCCKPCMDMHNLKLAEERANGHVCGMCGKPYGACYC